METVTAGIQTLEDLLRRDDTKKSLKAIDSSVQKALSDIKSSTETALQSMDATGERIVSQIQSIIQNFTKTIEAKISAAVAELRLDNASKTTSGPPAHQYFPPVPQYPMFYPHQPPPGSYPQSHMSSVAGQLPQYHPTVGPIDFHVPLAGSGSSTSPVVHTSVEQDASRPPEAELQSKGGKKRDRSLQESDEPSKKRSKVTFAKEPVKAKSNRLSLEKMTKGQLLKLIKSATSPDDDEDDESSE